MINNNRKTIYIIFDLEATCWEERNDKVKEVIEIGAVKLDEDLEVIDTFSEFIRPTIYPVLSEFCNSLTSIRQKDVDEAKYFNDAIKDFEDWILSSGKATKLVSWGHYDKKQMLEESAVKNYSGKIIELLEKHISLKHEFARMRKERTCGMKKALNKLNLSLEGTHHRGIDDAKNIARIFKVIFSELKSNNII
ncbi:MAG: 3'-5' exonuclease [Parcubacteria group bacterium]|jgi:inhibitor of KinA sporulation pathway (predicted exonuclease)